MISFFYVTGVADDNGLPTLGGCLRVIKDCATILRNKRLFIFAPVISLNAINTLHNARSIKPKKIRCHHFLDFLDNPYEEIS